MNLTCRCEDGQHPFGTAVWHRSYRRWFAHDRAGHRARAAVWGWFADRVVRFA